MWVKKPSRVPGRSHTVLTLAQISRTELVCGSDGLTVRGVLDQRQRQRDRQHAERDHRQIGRRPARAGEQRQERHRREHLAELAADPGQLRHQRNLLRPEPVRHQPQHRDEGDRVAEADDRPRGDRGGQRLGERQRQLARRHHRRTRNDQRLRAEPVEQQARRHLGARVDHDLKNDERRQHARGLRRTGRRPPDPRRRAWCGRGRRRCMRRVRWPKRSRDARGNLSRINFVLTSVVIFPQRAVATPIHYR